MTIRGSKKPPAARWMWILAALTLTAIGGATLGLAAPSPDAVQVAAARGAVRVKPIKTVRLDFVEANVADVIKALSIQSGANIALMPSVTGSVTLRAMDLGLEAALKQVAAVVGADVRHFDTTYFVGTVTELRTMIARKGVRGTVRPEYAKAAELMPVLTAAYPYLSVTSVGGSANLLLLTGDPEDVQAAKKLVAEADQAPKAGPKPPAPKPARKTYVLNYADAGQAAAALKKALPDSQVEVAGGALIVNGLPEAHTLVADFLGQYDVEGNEKTIVRAYQLKYLHPRQAALSLRKIFDDLTFEAGPEPYDPPQPTFTPLSTETEQAFSQQALGQGQSGTTGAAASASESNVEGPGSRSRVLLVSGDAARVEQATAVLESLDIKPKQFSIKARIVDVSPEKMRDAGFNWNWSSLQFFEKPGPPGSPRIRNGRAPLEFGGFVRAPFDFSTTLTLMETKKIAKLLAEPNVQMMDGTSASIFIGDILRFETLSTVTDGGSQQFNVEVVPVGIALLVRPRLNEDNTITMRVHPVVSTVTGFTGRFNDIPITASRETDSTVIIRDGETIAISGLMRDEEIRSMSKIPFISEIPFIGELFKRRTRSRKKSEVTVFITTNIVGEDE